MDLSSGGEKGAWMCSLRKDFHFPCLLYASQMSCSKLEIPSEELPEESASQARGVNYLRWATGSISHSKPFKWNSPEGLLTLEVL